MRNKFFFKILDKFSEDLIDEIPKSRGCPHKLALLDTDTSDSNFFVQSNKA